jgi:hypothetical protein
MNLKKRRNLINERLSVSDTVIEMTKEIKNIILQRVKYNKKYMSKTRNIVFDKGMFNYATNGKLNIPYLKVKYIIYHLNNDEQYSLLLYNNIINTNCVSDYEEKSIELKLVLIHEKPSKDFDYSIQHELNHIYQYDNGQTKNEDFYKKVIDMYKNGTDIEKVISYALYLSFTTEQDSMASQYYAYLKQNKVSINALDDFPFDDGNPYNEISNVLDKIDSIKIDENILINKLGINRNRFDSIIDNAEKRLFNKLSKVMWRYREEKQTNEDKKDTDIPKNFKYRMNFVFECMDKGITEYEEDFFD